VITLLANPNAEWEYPVGARIRCDDGVDAIVTLSEMGVVMFERPDGSFGGFHVQPDGTLVDLGREYQTLRAEQN
jgi:hypothetical protein